MKTVIFRPLVFLLLLLPSVPALYGQHDMPKPNWDRTLALHTAYATDTQALLKPLFNQARSGDTTDLISSLSAIQADARLSAPARDYLMFSFVQGLSDMDANAVDSKVLDLLSSYEALTLVEHDDFAGSGVPLFNIRAATAGVRHTWERQLAQDRAQALLQESTEQWIAAYLSATATERRGMADSLGFAAAPQLQELGWSALARIDKQPELTLIAAQAGLESDDFELVQQSISKGTGPGMSQILQAAASRLSSDEALAVLENSVRLGSDSKAGLAIAQLAPAHLDHPGIRTMLFETLSSRNLGAAAGMLLGASNDPAIQKQLGEIASGEDGLARKRASLALNSRQVEVGAAK